MTEGLLIGREVTQTAVSSKPTPAWETAHKAGNLEQLHGLRAAQQSEEGPFKATQLGYTSSRQVSWGLLLPAAARVESSLQLVLSEGLSEA